MRDDAPSAAVLAAAAGWQCRVGSWLGDTLLADDIPIGAGTWRASASTQVIESLDLTVPPGYSGEWVPRDDTSHPLAAYGQQLDTTLLVTDGGGVTTWEIPLARSGVQDWSDPDLGDVTVRAAGPLQRVADARLASPRSTKPSATLESELRTLIVAGIPVDVDAALTDRSVPSFSWQDDRLGAVYDLVSAWPALLRVTPTGGVYVGEALPSVHPGPVMTWTDGEGGTVASAPRSDARSGRPNSIVARGMTADGTPVQAEAHIETGSMAVDGPYGVVREFLFSPLLTTVGQCQAAADTALARKSRPLRTVRVTAAPDPRVELYDPVRVVRDERTYDGWVWDVTLPLTVADGDMVLEVALGAP